VLYRHSEVFRTMLGVADVSIVALAWTASYWLRFESGWFDAPLGVPPFEPYLYPLALIIPLWLLLFRSHGLYEPQRTSSLLHEWGTVIRATAMGVVLLVAATFFVRSYFYSRGVVAAFSVLAPAGIIAFRTAGRIGLRSLRRRGYNLRYVIVVGAGQLAEEIIERIHAHPEAGLHVLGIVADTGRGGRRVVCGVPVVGGLSDLKASLHGEVRVDEVVIALAQAENASLEKVLADLEDEVVNVKLVPDILQVTTLRSSVESLDGLPMIGLRESPMVGWHAVQKRVFDLVAASVAMVVAAPAMGLVAVAVWVTSGRPIFYSQQRAGLDGRVFRMFKFRSMRTDAERDTGPVWTSCADDPRRTRLGAWLRRFNLDELPQLWHVLRGDMSLVGPRPERPVFIEEFRHEVPGYMLRHKVRAGLTGWAQVHGWRGDTSLEERVEHDIYYIQNWSLGLDVRILLMTIFHGRRNAA
jgi:Undecaprenyl-phosphate glucose phosphotransferase